MSLNISVDEFGRSSNFADLMVDINTATNGWFVGLIVIFVWFIILSVLINLKPEISFVAHLFNSSFIMIILTGLLVAVGLLPISISIFFIIIFLFAFGLLAFK